MGTVTFKEGGDVGNEKTFEEEEDEEEEEDDGVESSGCE